MIKHYKFTSIFTFIIFISLTIAGTSNVPAQDKAPQQTRAQILMGATDPKLAELTDTILYGDIWERPELSKRDRSLITVAALIAMDRKDQLRSHMKIALQNDVTQQELVETITHLAFYSGWPNSVSAVAIAKDVFVNEQDK